MASLVTDEVDPVASLEQMDVVVEDVEAIDEMQVAFSELETAQSKDETLWQQLLQNERSDELATKIKEQCIYR